jgi:hypothetical protein
VRHSVSGGGSPADRLPEIYWIAPDCEPRSLVDRLRYSRLAAPQQRLTACRNRNELHFVRLFRPTSRGDLSSRWIWIHRCLLPFPNWRAAFLADDPADDFLFRGACKQVGTNPDIALCWFAQAGETLHPAFTGDIHIPALKAEEIRPHHG